MAFWIVLFLRLIVPLSILRFPLAGGVAALLLDALDVVIGDGLVKVFGYPQNLNFNYHALDKWLDMYYLGLELLVALSWENVLARRTAAFLFGFRTVGVLIFELTGIQRWLFYFPNLFENWYLYYLFAVRFFPRFIPKNLSQLLLVLLILYIPKFVQEWLLHYKLAHPWGWLRGKLF